MRHTQTNSSFGKSVTGSRIPRRLIAVLGFAALFATAGAAQTQMSPSCAPGLMSRDETESGTLLLRTSTPGCYLGAPRVAADISIEIAGPIARTKVTQRFENPANSWVEGVYLFPLPEGAAVDTLKMKVGDRFIEGQIKERQEARQIYEAAKAEGKKASLVEQDRPNVFTNQVANIGPHETVVVQIEYQESLRFEKDRYSLRVPLVVAPRYNPPPRAVVADNGDSPRLSLTDPVPDRDRLDAPVLRPEWGKMNPATISVHLEAGFPIGDIQSDSHAVSIVRSSKTAATLTLKDGQTATDGDFTLSFSAARDAAPTVSLLKERTGDGDYLMALVVPPSADQHVQPKPREAIFVLDNSGSMEGESIRQAKAGLLLALGRLKPTDRFNVIRFDDTLTVLFPYPVPATPENISNAESYVSSIAASGGTEMLPALLAALNDETPNDTSHLRQVIFLTDGEVGNEAELFSAIANKLGRSRLFTVGIGSAPNAFFMSGAARAGRGTYTYIGSIDEVGPRMAELFAKLERPVMTDLAAHWADVNDAEIWPNPLPDLYVGEPVMLTAKTAKLKGTLLLSGRLGEKAWAARLDLSRAHDAAGIEKLWARNKIAALDDSRVLGADADQIDKAVLQVALDHHLTSRVTSLVAVDVTSSRPLTASLTTRSVPLNLPAGWDFDKVFGKERDVDIQHADIPAGLLKQLDGKEHAENAVRPADAPMVLPQGATDSRLLLIAGVMLTALALMLLGARRKFAGMRS
ncbi:MAG: marine proteobacterial sortase target protein [Proteobacteria bacterium]|nr:marine proteobacterial sortase target protein [Pseudomonadota bacterium]